MAKSSDLIMRDTIVFSVLMSLYKKENPQFLRECLISLTRQTVLANEVVLVFDGEVGIELEKIVNEYEGLLNIHTLKLEKNMGLGVALNLGLAECKYNIVIRMDTDDICRPNRFERQLAFLKSHKDISLVGSEIIEFDGSGNKRLKSLPQTLGEIKKFSKMKNPFNHMTVAFHKQKVIDVGGYQHHLYMEDYNLWLRMISGGLQVANIPEVLVEARVGGDMVKKRRGLNYLKSEWKLMVLKNHLQVTSKLEGIMIFFVRALTRIIPHKLLSYLYTKDRKKIEGNNCE